MRRCSYYLIAGCFFFYVVFNLVLISVVPVIQKVDLTFCVRHVRSKMPIQGASFLVVGGPLPASVKPLGVTGRDGILKVDFRFHDNPQWWWPRIGHYRFRKRMLRIRAEGCEERSYLLADLLRDLTYKNPTGSYEIELNCDEHCIEYEIKESTRLNKAD